MKLDMQQSVGRRTTAVGTDGVVPTEYQIRHGHLVIPAGFYVTNRHAVPWKTGFDLVAFGSNYRAKKIDDDRRLYVRLRDHVTPGDVLRLSIRGCSLYITKGGD